MHIATFGQFATEFRARGANLPLPLAYSRYTSGWVREQSLWRGLKSYILIRAHLYRCNELESPSDSVSYRLFN